MGFVLESQVITHHLGEVRQEVKKLASAHLQSRAEGTNALTLPAFSLSSFLAYIVHSLCLGNGAIHNGLNLPTLVNNKDMPTYQPDKDNYHNWNSLHK